MTNNKKRLIFVNRFFYPDISATSQILTELVFELAKHNYEITVVTGSSSYDHPGTTFPKIEITNGVKIIRVAKTRFSRLNFIGRFIDLCWFYLCVSIRLLVLVKYDDVLICKTDPPMLIVLGAVVRKFKNCTLISWNQDLFPEVAQSLFTGFPKSLIYSVFLRVRNWAFKQSRLSIAISQSMAANIRALDINNVQVIPNWGKNLGADKSEIDELKADWNVQNKFIVAYSGNFGFVHEYQTIKKTIDLCKSSKEIIFLFIGSGRNYAELEDHVKTNKLGNVIFKPYQPEKLLGVSLSIADVHLISLKPEMEGLVFPSKFYSVCAVSRPVLFVGDDSGELSKLIEEHNCGKSFRTGQAKEISAYLNQIRSNPDSLDETGVNAYQLFKNNFTLDHAVSKWILALDQV